jgi:plastocyanin
VTAAPSATTAALSTEHRQRALRPWVLVASLLAAALTVVGLAACSGSGSGQVEQTGLGKVVEIEAVDNVFKAETIEIEPGTEVRWVNKGRNAHDVTPTEADLGDWGIKLADFEPGVTYSHVFTEPGESPYYCTAHGTKTRGMIGKIVVTG